MEIIVRKEEVKDYRRVEEITMGMRRNRSANGNK